MPIPSPRRRIARRSLLGGSLGAATLAALPRGGVFAAGSDVIRVGLVGCGGRGTGAALQAAAEPGVVVTALGDCFTDQLAAAVDILAARLGRGFACPAGSRFVGEASGLDVIAADVDVVILATPPHLRPAHVTAAIRAGRHVYCETPAAVDVAGVQSILATAAEARQRGLSFVAGLHSRHDESLRRTIGLIHEGAIGRPRRGEASCRLDLPWRRPALPGSTHRESIARNWISHPSLSGGGFVEHHVHAIDRILWAFGDAAPVAVEPLAMPRPLPAPLAEPGAMAAGVSFVFADGRSIDAVLERRSGTTTEIRERVVGERAMADLRTGGISTADTVAGGGAAPGGHAACMASLLRSLRSGTGADDLTTLCRGTLAAVLGRDAAAAGVRLPWPQGWPASPPVPPLRPVQSDVV